MCTNLRVMFFPRANPKHMCIELYRHIIAMSPEKKKKLLNVPKYIHFFWGGRMLNMGGEKDCCDILLSKETTLIELGWDD